MLAYSHYAAARVYDEFLAAHGAAGDKARWDASRAAVTLTPDQTALLRTFTRELHVFVLAGAWCGDCAAQCPIFEAFATVAPGIKVKYFDRDTSPQVQAELTINGGSRVPVAVLFSEDGHEILRYGEKTLTAYRLAAQKLLPADACGLPVTGGGVVADWLREFERAHLIARLSPRLRKLHGD